MKTSDKQLVSRRKWAAKWPEKAQANKNNWLKSPEGRRWQRLAQARKNLKRAIWRHRRQRAGLPYS